MLVVGNGASNMLSSILFPSVAKSVAKLKRTPVVVVSSSGSVQHYGCGERAGEVETWDGGCALQVITSTSSPMSSYNGRGLLTLAQDYLLRSRPTSNSLSWV